MFLFNMNLKKYLELRGLTQQEMASLLHITQQAYGQYERANREPRIDTLRSISKILSVSLDELLGTTENAADILTRCTTYLESLGFRIEQDEDSVCVYFPDSSKSASHEQCVSFPAKELFATCISSVLDRSDRDNAKRREDAVYNALTVISMFQKF